MRSYNLLYSKIWKQVVAMTAVPICLIIPFLIFITQFKNLSETLFFVFTYAGLGVIILFTLYVIFKQAMVLVTITINGDGLEIIFSKRTIFNWIDRKHILLENIEYVSDDVDLNHNARKFFTLKLKDERGKIILTAPKKAPEEEMEAFSLELSNAIEQFNSHNTKLQAPIKKGSFYAGKFLTFLTWLFTALAILVTIMKILKPSSVAWYRIIWIYVFSASMVINYFSVKKKQTEKNL